MTQTPLRLLWHYNDFEDKWMGILETTYKHLRTFAFVVALIYSVVLLKPHAITKVSYWIFKWLPKIFLGAVAIWVIACAMVIWLLLGAVLFYQHVEKAVSPKEETGGED